MRARVLLLVGLLVTPVACSVVDDGKVQGIDPPNELTDTLPPTTTTMLATSTSPSGDHTRIALAKRVAFLDWFDSRLRGGTRWTDLRIGKGVKCSPAVRRPWTPPATPAVAPTPSDEDLTRRGACAS